jgi:hypothetical protein
MPGLNVSLSGDQLAHRMQDRLRGLNAAAPKTIVWQQNSNKVVIFVSTLAAKLLNGWLLCSLDLQSDQTGKQTLQFVFFLGSPSNGDGVHAGATINAFTPQASQLAEVWGADLQRVLWDAVLDALEVSCEQAVAQHPGATLAVQGFHVTADGLQTAILTGGK